jgi:uncharacterized membrane protein
MEVTVSLSHKRKKELKQLRRSAEELWSNQQVVIDRASKVAREAKRQAAQLAREHVAPHMRGSYEQYVRPHVSGACRIARSAGGTIEKKIVPAIGTALGTALSVVDVARNTRMQAALRRANPKLAAKTHSGPGIGTYIAVGLGVVAVAGITYAIWQTFRADDELWIADDDQDSSESSND